MRDGGISALVVIHRYHCHDPTTEMEHAASTASEITTLPTAMTAAACVGIAWYLCLELNIRLFVRSTRRSLYFWSCLLCSWAIIIHLILIILLDFRISNNHAVLVVVHLTWWAYVVSQSVVLYSRLNLVVKSTLVASYVLYSIVFTAIVFGLTTIVFGLVAVSHHSSLSQHLLTPKASLVPKPKTRIRKLDMG
jgi:hypothetical protein